MARKKKKSSGPVEADCDLTPMIDVTFLLLIFFILNLKFKVEEGEIENYLPKDKGQAAGTPSINLNDCRVKLLWYTPGGAPIKDPDDEETEGCVVLKVGKKAYNNVGDLTDGNMAIASVWQELHEHVLNFKERNTKGDKQPPVIIDARPQVPYRYVARALNEVVKAGVKDVTFAAPEKKY